MMLKNVTVTDLKFAYGCTGWRRAHSAAGQTPWTVSKKSKMKLFLKQMLLIKVLPMASSILNCLLSSWSALPHPRIRWRRKRNLSQNQANSPPAQRTYSTLFHCYGWYCVQLQTFDTCWSVVCEHKVVSIKLTLLIYLFVVKFPASILPTKPYI